jgi:hypothetical protein
MIGLLICLGWETFGTLLAAWWLNRQKRIRRMEPALVARVVLVSLMVGAIWPALVVAAHRERKLRRDDASREETEAVHRGVPGPSPLRHAVGASLRSRSAPSAAVRCSRRRPTSTR